MDRGWRDANLEGASTSLPSCDPSRKPPVCQLLARWRRHSRHQRSQQAAASFRFELESPFPWPRHSVVPVPFPINGRNYLIVADEDVNPLDTEMAPELAAFIGWSTPPTNCAPIPVSTFQVDGIHGKRNPEMTGCHQPVEKVRGTEIPVAWFAQGLRFIDFSNPMAPRESVHYIPDLPAGSDRVLSNDVFQDDRGIVYLIDRMGGLSIVERI